MVWKKTYVTGPEYRIERGASRTKIHGRKEELQKEKETAMYAQEILAEWLAEEEAKQAEQKKLQEEEHAVEERRKQEDKKHQEPR